jgi:hypothetical protein
VHAFDRHAPSIRTPRCYTHIMDENEPSKLILPNQLKQVVGGVLKMDKIDVDKARARHLKRKRRKPAK